MEKKSFLRWLPLIRFTLSAYRFRMWLRKKRRTLCPPFSGSSTIGMFFGTDGGKIYEYRDR